MPPCIDSHQAYSLAPCMHASVHQCMLCVTQEFSPPCKVVPHACPTTMHHRTLTLRNFLPHAKLRSPEVVPAALAVAEEPRPEVGRSRATAAAAGGPAAAAHIGRWVGTAGRVLPPPQPCTGPMRLLSGLPRVAAAVAAMGWLQGRRQLAAAAECKRPERKIGRVEMGPARREGEGGRIEGDRASAGSASDPT